MKTYFLNFALITSFIFIGLTSYSSTIVNGGTISNATWTLNGSPYLIQGNITIQNSLNIEPGVEVRFHGHYQILVDGILRAKGTNSQPIIFQMNDTTGWHIDSITNGGWAGIKYTQYSGTAPDSSLLEYCTIKDTKDAKNSLFYTVNIDQRSLNIINCNFFHNQGKMINVYTYIGAYNYEIKGCNFFNNLNYNILYLHSISPNSNFEVTNNHFYDNNGTIGGCLITAITDSSPIIIENNELDNNTFQVAAQPIRIFSYAGIVRSNKIHHNHADDGGAINCIKGDILIEKNLICNNIFDNLSNTCDGGGGLSLEGTASNYIVRDNIIANNYTGFRGGGIFITDPKVDLYNNTIVNNTSHFGSPAIYMQGLSTYLYCHNNIIYGNESVWQGNKIQIGIYAGTFFSFNHNWIPNSFSQTVYYHTSQLLNGPNTNCVVDSNPSFINPTLTNLYTDDATNKNFKLMATSSCIDVGDSSISLLSTTDFYAQNRINGTTIDIGAAEYYVESTSINEIKKDLIEVFPNPTSGQLSISFRKQDSYTLSIYNIQGQKIKSFNVSGVYQSDFSINEFVSGIYFLQVIDEDNNISFTKIIKD